ncbi:uncharacterized protein B0I36DRAFT_426507 [Microdochium trichocladiopsis]|uniref:D-xylose 1-dehydrogenase (NADP(+), D-xylono-1,5-lactone-forming) n=1 Tax=Microdochium trichocladiopsis TaxID=1682393 RepID=A0A9P8YH71_9PEZI|nr:uncharacterized protein B0I36DRAFT_426507 [Microdochium trichocladiopsis]KAH7039937.1 hypothetical protein B0I36DRAFT_426507 [Microdochium trichocladiopsis]
MSGLLDAVRRNWHMVNAEPVQKTEAPLRLGLIGASSIAPHSIINPVRTHADIVVHAVAARDVERAKAFAAKHDIPVVKNSYQDLLDDPEIDCVYISLPNSLHYEWALRALKAGKHTLLEKPGVSNSSEAEIVFRHPLLTPYALHVGPAGAAQVSTQKRDSRGDMLTGGGGALSVPPVLLEAMHTLFHPAWAAFMDYVDPQSVASARVTAYIPSVVFGNDSNRFRFELGGGALMDIGGYTASALLRVFGGRPPLDCLRCDTEPALLDPRCDKHFRAQYRFPNGGLGEMEGHLRASIDKIKPVVTVTHRPVVVPANNAAAAAASGVEYPIAAGHEIVRVRTVKFNRFLMPTFYHSIEVHDEYTLQQQQQVSGSGGSGSSRRASAAATHARLASTSTRSSAASSSSTTTVRLGSSGSSGRDGGVVKRWKKSQTVRAYTFEDAGRGQRGDASWTTYRYQLEQFVNKVRGRRPGQWFSAQDSLEVMRMLDMAYVTAGLPLRPTSNFTLEM